MAQRIVQSTKLYSNEKSLHVIMAEGNALKDLKCVFFEIIEIMLSVLMAEPIVLMRFSKKHF